MIFQSVDLLQHPFKEHDLILLDGADILRILAARGQVVFPDQTMPV